MPDKVAYKTKLFAVFVLCLAVYGVSSQESASLNYLPGIAQASLENPAIQTNSEKLVVGMPFFSGISGQWNSSVPLNSLFFDGFTYSFHRFYDALGETGKINVSANWAMFFVTLRHNGYAFNFSVSERAFGDAVFDREIIRIIRDGTLDFFGKNENLGDATFYLTHYREISAGISKQIWEGLNVGIRPKILFGKFHFNAENLNLTVKSFEDPEELHLNTSGNFTVAGPLKHVRDTVYKASSFWADFSPGDYFFQARNLGVAFDAGVVFKPGKFSEISLSVVDIGFIGFGHKAYDAEFDRPVIFIPGTSYQSYNPDDPNKHYLEPREAIIDFADSVSYVTTVTDSDRRNLSALPLKINIAGKQVFSDKLTAGVHIQYRNYKLQPLNLFTVYGTATLHPKFAFYGSVALLNTENIFPGFGASYTANWLQVYFASNNILSVFQPMATKQLNLSFGINFLIDTP